MFEMKYDAKGNPLKNPEMENAAQQQIADAPVIKTIEQMQQEQSEPHELQAQEVQENVQEQEMVTAVQQQPDQKSRDWRELREKSNKAEQERDAAMRQLREYEKLIAQHIQQPKQQEPHALQPQEDDELKIGDDELAEGKHLSKVGRKIKKLEEQLKNYQNQTLIQTTEARLKANYPDFEKVVNNDTITRLSEQYPELSSTINTSSNDLYAKAVSAYTMIKKFGIYEDPSMVAERETAIKNSAKPRPLASVSPQQGESPLNRANAFANGLTDDLKAQLRKEMEDARRMH